MRLLFLDRPIVALKIPVMVLGKSFVLGKLLSLNPNKVCQKSLGTPTDIGRKKLFRPEISSVS